MRIGAIAVVFSCVTLLVGPQEGQENQQVFRAGLKAVAVYVTVSDAQGRLVPDLTKEDFEVYDNGKKQEITLFDNGVQPITVVLMLDRSGSMVGNFSLVRSAAEQFVAQLLPADKARIGSFANRVQVDPREFTGSQHDLLEILRTELQEPGPTPLWNAVNVGITSLLHQEGRRVVLVFTDGIDRPFGSNNISYRDVEKNAEQEDVMIFAVGLASREFGGGRRRGGPPMGGVGPSLRLPAEEPMKTLTPAQPGRRSSTGSSAAFSWVPPMKKAKLQCMRPVARRILSSKVSRVTVSGLVLGISKTPVTPPITADREPEARSSLCSRPGSRKCTCVSMTPGRM